MDGYGHWVACRATCVPSIVPTYTIGYCANQTLRKHRCVGFIGALHVAIRM